LKEKSGREKITKVKNPPLSVSFKNQRGQVAIFVALIFQVLFVFFAMVVNVGLLVHHKINLQNSVDLAAYYGAMKQAEVLNAVAHINYQIHQSWKLMVFRHRHLGMGGLENGPYNRRTQQISNEDDVPVDYSPSFCLLYRPFDYMATLGNSRSSGGENYCGTQNQKIPLPGVPNAAALGLFTSLFSGIFTSIQQTSAVAVKKIQNDCKGKMTQNNIALASFIYAYKLDVANRKRLLFRVANGLSADTKDFKDLDGESAFTGIENTLKKNLTAQNKDGFKNIEILNSMGASGCGISGDAGSDQDLDPPKWLSEIFTDPVYDYTEYECKDGKNLNAVRKIMNRPDEANAPTYPESGDAQYRELYSLMQKMRPIIYDQVGSTPEQRMFKTSMGFEKNPWCMAYVGVKASAEPSIPFSPFGSVKLTASSYAKPFGGRIGPWYKEEWTQNSNESDNGKYVDKLEYIRVKKGEPYTPSSDPNTVKKMWPNVSRYVGDKVGSQSKLTSAYMQKMLNETKDTFLGTWWVHLHQMDMEKPNGNGDILAWDSLEQNKSVIMRDIEISAIAPDQFDLAYYSIEPDFNRNYQRRLQTRFSNLNVRGDLGQRPSAGCTRPRPCCRPSGAR
jgi:hypothetical protein